MRLLATILCLCTGLLANSREQVRAYADTSKWGVKLKAAYRQQGFPDSLVLFEVDRHFLAESSYGIQLYGDDSTSLGWFQDAIHVVLAREHPNGYSTADSLTIRRQLINDWQFNEMHFLQTKYEMFRLHVQRGRTGRSLRYAAIRSVNAGSKRERYMSAMATRYRDKILGK